MARDRMKGTSRNGPGEPTPLRRAPACPAGGRRQGVNNNLQLCPQGALETWERPGREEDR